LRIRQLTDGVRVARRKLYEAVFEGTRRFLLKPVVSYFLTGIIIINKIKRYRLIPFDEGENKTAFFRISGFRVQSSAPCICEYCGGCVKVLLFLFCFTVIKVKKNFKMISVSVFIKPIFSTFKTSFKPDHYEY